MIAQRIITESELFFNTNKKKVSSEEISSLEKKCKKYLNDSNKTLEQLIETFNNLATEVGKLMMEELPINDDIKFLNKGLERIIYINRVEPISIFIKNVYSISDYRISLKKGKDDFFINASPQDVLKNHSDVVESNDDNIKKFFEFKNYWGRLSANTKLTIKAIMSTLIDITQKYIEVKDDTNDIAKILIRLDTSY